MLTVVVRICISPKFCDSLLECAVTVSPSAAFAFREREPSPLLRAPCRLLTGTGGIYSVSKNFQTLLFAFILASSRELVSAASYSKSNPLILCLQFWAAPQSGSGSRRRLSFQDFFPFEACLQPAFSPNPPQACWCLLVQHSCVLLRCKCCCDPEMTDT